MENPPLAPPPPETGEASTEARHGTRKSTPRGAPSERALAARRANLAKARAAPRERLYRSTERRQAASRANLEKAIAARRAPEGNAAARLNALKHGMFAKRTVAASITRLGESPEMFGEHLRLFAQVFAPQNDEEKDLVRRLAETVWRRLRLHIAQATQERERLQELFRSAPTARQLTAQETVDRADALAIYVGDHEAYFREANKIQSEIEYLLRELLRKRSGGEIQYWFHSPRRDPAPKQEDDDDDGLESDWFERLMAMSPEERQALAERVKKSDE